MSTQEVLEAKGSLGAPCSIGETRWQVLLFRAIKEGNFDMFMHQATSHPEAIHDYFTKDMHEWELEWESPKWFEFVNATALYIASSYSQPYIIEWLIENGADPSVTSFCGQKPVDVIGQCSRGSNDTVKQVKFILERPQKVFKAPLAPTTATRAAAEDEFVTEYQEIPSVDGVSPPLKIPKRVRQRVVKAKIDLNWRCYWIPNNAPFEMRYREQNSDPDWKTEKCINSSKTLEGLPLSTTYEFQTRARNNAGWSEWSPIISVTTPDKSLRKD